MGALIDMERKGCELIIHDHDRDLWVTMVGWMDVLESDWGDFRLRNAVDIYSFTMIPVKPTESLKWSGPFQQGAVLPVREIPLWIS